MIFFQDLNKISQHDKQKFIEWKADAELCDLIMSTPVNLSSEQLEYWIENNFNDPNQYFKSVHRVSDNKLIGLARLMFIDQISRIAEVGLYIGDIEDRKGKYGTAILNQLIEVAEKKYLLNKIFAKIQNHNFGSIKLFKKAGFIEEGLLRDHYFSKISNEFIDVLILSKFIDK
jgi:RimJ/RimL family protein N-acetyltransferase